MKLLDCTLRDGGYYTKWDFNKELVDSYINCIDKLPIEYIEIGYRSLEANEYLGEYFYLTLTTIKNVKSKTSKKLAIMLNAKDCNNIENIDNLLSDLVNTITLVRIAIDPKNINHGIKLAKKIKHLGFEVALNVMYISKIKDNDNFFAYLEDIEDIIDYLNLVDSYGSIYPNQLNKLITKIKDITSVNLGFHGHNNLELAFVNALEAINNGCVIVDSTVFGMGRGAGNLKTELFLTYLRHQNNLEVDLNVLGNLVELFKELARSYQWGTNLAYMVSGAYSLPQKDVMEALEINRYSLSGIINQMNNNNDLVLPKFNSDIKGQNCLIIGGGDSVKEHYLSIQEYLSLNQEVVVIHSSSKYIDLFKKINNIQILAIAGDELLKSKTISNIHSYILQPSPRKINNSINNQNNFYELKNISFIDKYFDSPLSISLQIALDIQANQIFLVGFDGYQELKSKKELYLMKENQEIIDNFLKIGNLISLTFTKYHNLKQQSIYGKIIHEYK